MLNVPKRANDAMHMSMLDGYDVSLPHYHNPPVLVLFIVYYLLVLNLLLAALGCP